MTPAERAIQAFARTAAAAEPAAGLDVAWRDLLFDGDALRDPSEPSQALLATTAGLWEGLRAHYETIPERARRRWLEETLGIAALPMVPDEVVAVATAEPGAVPAVLPSGTELRAAKAEGVPERTYVTTDALTVLGATFAGVHGYVSEDADDWAHFSGDVATPFVPFAGHAAEHRIDFVTDEIAFPSGEASVTLRLAGAPAKALQGAQWTYSTADGVAPVASAVASGEFVSLKLNAPCVPCDLDGEPRTFLRVTIPGDLMTQSRYDLRFDKVEVAVRRQGVVPEAAFHNDGVLDLTKEAKPFGPVPRRGDAFYLRCDEAFSRPLTSLRIDVRRTDEAPATVTTPTTPAHDPVLDVDGLVRAAIRVVLQAQGLTGAPADAMTNLLDDPILTTVHGIIGESPRMSVVYDAADSITEAVVTSTVRAIVGDPPPAILGSVPAATHEHARRTTRGLVEEPIRASVRAFIGTRPEAAESTERRPMAPCVLAWEQYRATGWESIGTPYADLDLVRGYTPPSRRTEVAATPGWYARLRIVTGDFGWSYYLQGIARFAAAAAGPGDPDANDLIPPEPPAVTGVTITYTTSFTSVHDVRTRNEPATGGPYKADVRPFFQPVREEGERAGAVTFGFSLPASLRGSTLAWYALVAQAPACASAGQDHDARWEYWSEAGAWVEIDALDGSRGLRQSGLVRFVTPRDWAEGCDDVGAKTARWLRLRTTTTTLVGDLLGVHVDAMTARYRPLPGVVNDLAPLTPLVPQQLKGLRVPVAGIKVTNPAAGTPGRSAEDQERYRLRAGSVVRHRNRAIQAWDYETLVTAEFPEVAVVRCLPHADADGCVERGSVGLVVLPRTGDRMPKPTVALADRIAASLRPRMPVHARPVVLCPEYVPIRFRAVVVLRRGVAAAEARVRILAAVERHLHPLSGVEGAPFGQSLYPSSLLAFLEGLDDVDHVTSFGLLSPDTTGDVVPVDACRGLIASGGDHDLALEEQL